MAKSKKLISLSLVFLLVVGLVILLIFYHRIYDIGAVCPKCLQSASITEIRVLSVPIFKWTTYDDYISLSYRYFSLDTEIHPNIYNQIFDRRCRHELKRGGFGYKRFNIRGDGVSLERRLYQSRIEAIVVLYSVFKRLPNKPLAQRTYKLIDSIIPMNQEEHLKDAFILERDKMLDNFSEKELKEYFPFAYPMYLRSQELRKFTVQILEVESENQWESLLSELTEKIENIKLPRS